MRYSTSAILDHARHHLRFYSASAIGLVVGAMVQAQPAVRLMLAGDSFFVLYLALVAVLSLRLSPEEMRRRASVEDVGIALILLMTVVAIVVTVASIFALLSRPGAPSGSELGLSVASVLLGWLTLHTVVAFHYAHLFYQREDDLGQRSDACGLAFPGTAEPEFSDFLYFSFVIGMTAQVSDVQVTEAPMRRLVLLHGILSFLFNTVLLALAVNVAAGQVH